MRVASAGGEHREMFSTYKVPQRGYGNIMSSVTVDQRVKIVNNGGTMHERSDNARIFNVNHVKKKYGVKK